MRHVYFVETCVEVGDEVFVLVVRNIYIYICKLIRCGYTAEGCLNDGIRGREGGGFGSVCLVVFEKR